MEPLKDQPMSYGYEHGDFVQPDLARSRPHKFVGNEFESPESFRTLVQHAG